MTDTLAAIGVALIEYAVWIGVGVIAVAVYFGRRNDRSEAHVKAAVHWMEHALEEALRFEELYLRAKLETEQFLSQADQDRLAELKSRF